MREEIRAKDTHTARQRKRARRSMKERKKEIGRAHV